MSPPGVNNCREEIVTKMYTDHACDIARVFVTSQSNVASFASCNYQVVFKIYIVSSYYQNILPFQILFCLFDIRNYYFAFITFFLHVR